MGNGLESHDAREKQRVKRPEPLREWAGSVILAKGLFAGYI
jgi:hypothetical protein